VFARSRVKWQFEQRFSGLDLPFFLLCMPVMPVQRHMKLSKQGGDVFISALHKEE